MTGMPEATACSKGPASNWGRAAWRLRGVAALVCLCASGYPAAAAADVALAVTPLAWNIVGLDSNSPAAGPNQFPVGARVCNEGSTGATEVTARFEWDDGGGVFVGDAGADPFINLRADTHQQLSLGPLAAGGCADAYFEAEVTKDPNAYNRTRAYHITASDAGSGVTATSPRPRELYVEYLVSQNRNAVTDIRLDGVSIPAGNAMTLMVGNTYTIELVGGTATQGYNQFEAFINFPNTIFQILSVKTTYSADDSPYVPNPDSKLYADACLWDSDPASPNYRSCVGGDYKAGGSTVVTAYTVRILSGAGTSQRLNSLLYDFSGSSYHYNADYGVGARIVNIVGPAAVTIAKAFAPKVIAPGDSATLRITLTNPTTQAFSGVNFTDTFPAGMTLFDGATTNTCGGSLADDAGGGLNPGDLGIQLAGGALSPGSVCTITANVTAADGTYDNTTGHLFINSSVDTGNSASDTLVVSSDPPPPSTCGTKATMATWTMPPGSGGPPPPYTTKEANVSTATASSTGGTFAINSTNGNPVNSWSGSGWPETGMATPPGAGTTPYYEFTVDTSDYGGGAISFQYYMPNGDWANVGNNFVYVYSRADGGAFDGGTVYAATKGSWQTITLAAAATGSATTTFRIAAAGAKTTPTPGVLYLDNIALSGCVRVDPPTIAKSFDPAAVQLTATATLTFTIVNPNSTVALSGIAVSDVLPAGIVVGDSSIAACGGILGTTAATRTVALTGGSLAAGGSCTFGVTVTGAAAGWQDNVTGFISSTETGASTNYAAASLLVIAPPLLAKSFAPPAMLTGETSTLTFTIANPNLTASLTGITFTDALPGGLSATNGTTSPLCGGSLTVTGGNQLGFAGGLLGAGGSCSFSLPVTGTTAGAKVNTTSAVASVEGGAGNSASATLAVRDPVPLLGLNKQVSTDGTNWFKFVGLTVPGAVYYRFTVSNEGEVALDDVSVTDPDVAMAGCTPPLPASLAVGESASCAVGPVAIGAVPTPDPFVNTATAHTSTYTPSPDVTSSARYGTMSLTVAKSATEGFFSAAGEVLHYRYVVTNTGGYPLAGPVTVEDDKTPDESCPSTTSVGDLDTYLDPGESITCTATYTVTAGDLAAGSVTNAATATAAGVTSPTARATVGRPALAVVKTSTTVSITAAGQAVPYVFTVTNVGTVALTGITVVDPMCDGVPAYVSGDTNTDSRLDPPEAWVYACSHTVSQPEVDAGANLSNTVTAASSESAPASATLSIPVAWNAVLQVVKSSPIGVITAAGQVVPYDFVVTNSGSVTLTGITVTDPMCDAPPASGGTDTSGPLPVGMAWGYTCSHTVTQAEVDAGGTLSNTVTADSNESAPATSTWGIPVSGSVDLSVTKTDGVTTVMAGGSSTYVVTVRNDGPGAVVGAVLSDAIPPQVETWTWTCTADIGAACTPGPATGAVNFVDVVSIPAGMAVTYVVSASIRSAATGDLVNTATIAPPPATIDPNPANNSATDIDTVSHDAELSLVKTASPPFFEHVGQVIAFTLAARNEGGSALDSVLIADPQLASIECTPAQPATLAPGAELVCTGTHAITQEEWDAGAVHNTATATGMGGAVEVQASAVVEKTLASILPPASGCGDFAGGSVAGIDTVGYRVRDNRITRVRPEFFRYYSTIVAPAANFRVVVRESKSLARWPFLPPHTYCDITIWDSNCSTTTTRHSAIWNPETGVTTLRVRDAQPGQTYYLDILFKPRRLRGIYESRRPTVEYTFTTVVGGVPLSGGTDAITVTPESP